VIPAIAAAADDAIQSVVALAIRTPGSPFLHQSPESLVMSAGCLHQKGQPASSGTPFQDILKMAKVGYAAGDGKTGGLGSDTKAHDYSTHSFGAQFVEVEWDPGIAKLRVSRVVSVIDGGRIINMKTATNQIAGAVVMGVGMGLLEETFYDPRNGHPINDNFADYVVPTHADSPQIDVTFLNIPDPMLGEYGARGIGEIGLAGVAPAITAAVYHATGVRVRSLPVRIEDLLTARV
jgi:xanthine dehydrogenase YagR molybdenum-binding subunit